MSRNGRGADLLDPAAGLQGRCRERPGRRAWGGGRGRGGGAGLYGRAKCLILLGASRAMGREIAVRGRRLRHRGMAWDPSRDGVLSIDRSRPLRRGWRPLRRGMVWDPWGDGVLPIGDGVLPIDRGRPPHRPRASSPPSEPPFQGGRRPRVPCEDLAQGGATWDGDERTRETNSRYFSEIHQHRARHSNIMLARHNAALT